MPGVLWSRYLVVRRWRERERILCCTESQREAEAAFRRAAEAIREGDLLLMETNYALQVYVHSGPRHRLEVDLD